jgi:dinuclear metal center YbgI/SA1388 family protein
VSELTVGDVQDVLDALYPPALAEDWDVVGLAIGSRAQPVTRIAYAVDCTTEVIAEARASGADLLVTHHPPFLRGLPAVDLEHPKGRLVADALAAGLSVVVAHTNADVPRFGVVEALADLVGLRDRRPLRPPDSTGPLALDKIITFVPADRVDAIIDALAGAGAGQIGAYERCAFTSTGEGTFRPTTNADPYLGRIGETAHVAETRVEMVLDRSRRRAVRDALLAAHPYEEPAYDLLELAGLPSADFGLGRVGQLEEPTTLGGLADRLAASLPATARGLLIAGEADRVVSRVAVQAGAGDDLLDEARQAGADAYVTSDLRHHPASEAAAWPDAPALIDISHWAAEWTWLPVVQLQVDEALGGRRVSSYVSTFCTDPWTGRA